jgi:hypothetical protein
MRNEIIQKPGIETKNPGLKPKTPGLKPGAMIKPANTITPGFNPGHSEA